jgi:hypothetical protein
MDRINSYTQGVLLALPMLLLGAVLLAPSATAGDACQIRVEVTNPETATSKADISRLGVRVRGGTWRNIQQHGERILAPGQTYVETFSPTIATEACDARRRYRVKVTCKSSGGGGLTGVTLPGTASKNWIYEPSETDWTTSQTVKINADCP